MTNHVPTLSTCQRLKAAGFPQNTWVSWSLEGELAGTGFFKSFNVQVDCAAPLLTELLEQLPNQTQLYKGKTGLIFRRIGDSTRRDPCESDNPAEAAALLWLELKETT